MLLAPAILHSQIHKPQKYAYMVYKQRQQRILSLLSDDYVMGRESGTKGSQICGSFIKSEFEEYGLSPLSGGTFTQSFKKDSIIFRNIIGLVRSQYYSEKYIVISAHYDHLGTLDGKIYNGADDNASGVTALLNIAQMFAVMNRAKEGPAVNIIFAAFDGKENNMAGSEHFLDSLPFNKKDIICNINIDQIGSIFAPPYKDTNYLLIVGAEKYKKLAIESKSHTANRDNNINLELDFTFYGSPAFAQLFFKTSDQYSFASRNIPAIMITSGIHAHTYKPSDDEEYINYPVLERRTKFIFFLIHSLSISR